MTRCIRMKMAGYSMMRARTQQGDNCFRQRVHSEHSQIHSLQSDSFRVIVVQDRRTGRVFRMRMVWGFRVIVVQDREFRMKVVRRKSLPTENGLRLQSDSDLRVKSEAGSISKARAILGFRVTVAWDNGFRVKMVMIRVSRVKSIFATAFGVVLVWKSSCRILMTL